MTLIPADARTTARYPRLSRLRLPQLAILASLKAIPVAIGRAATMAYVAPYAPRDQARRAEDELEGRPLPGARDPRW